MSIIIDKNYDEHLRDAQPTHFGGETIHPPKGSMSAPRIVPPLTIPPINTDIQFSAVLPAFNLYQHPGIAGMDMATIPDIFDWRHITHSDSKEIKKKKSLIATPGNQALCGSCWAISGAGIVADNFVVSGLVTWKPDLSTTWSLACYPQQQCKGGNPAVLFEDIAKGGIVSNHCIDYSWCSQNPECNGSALKHFKESKETDPNKVDLSTLIPTCGCYFGDKEHYLYKINPNSKSMSIGVPGITEKNIAATVKKHIYTIGPVMGGFIVYKNFMKGFFSKMNGGVYFDRGVYDKGEISFSDDSVSSENYAGSHAIAVIGWGMAKNIVIDETGKKDDVPYWYCRNSWTEKWGDGGYFKMAMYPYNKLSQFDLSVTIETPQGQVKSGGMVMLSVSDPPEKKTLKQISDVYMNIKRENPNDYYSTDPKYIPPSKDASSGSIFTVKHIIFSIIILLIIVGIVLFWIKRPKTNSSSSRGRSSGGGIFSIFRKGSGRSGSY